MTDRRSCSVMAWLLLSWAIAALLLIAAVVSCIATPSSAVHVGAARLAAVPSEGRVPASEHDRLSPEPHSLWDNGRAGTSSQPDTVSSDARCASPTAGVVVRGGLDHAPRDPAHPGVVLGEGYSSGSVPGMVGPARPSRLWPSQLPRQTLVRSALGVGDQPRADPGGSIGLSHLRQPAVCRPLASVSRDASRQHARCLRQRSICHSSELGREQSQRPPNGIPSEGDSSGRNHGAQSQRTSTTLWGLSSDDHQDREQTQVAEGGLAPLPVVASAASESPDASSSGLASAPAYLRPMPNAHRQVIGPLTGTAADVYRQGIWAWADPSHGSGYLAIPEGPGWLILACGPAACIERVSTDAGPALYLQRAGRLGDLSAIDFEAICGLSAAQRVIFGLCPGSLTILSRPAGLPETDQ